MSNIERGAGGFLGSSVYAALCDALRDGVYRPGDRLREEEVARRFSVSRTPVREALARLQSRGLVEQADRRGLRVRVLQERDILDLYKMREMIEGAAAGIVAEQASPSEIEMLRELTLAFEAARDDRPVMVRVNSLFHAAIHRLARNRYLDLTLKETRDAIALLGTSTFTNPDRMDKTVHEHREIVDAIAAREPGRAEAAARAHIRSSLQTRLQLMHETVGFG